MTTPTISVVIATLNRETCLCDTIRYFLERETYPSFEVIVIDQSRDHTPETKAFLTSVASRIMYVQAPYKSLTKARNHGVWLATGDVVLFVDDDVVPRTGFLAAHAGAFDDPLVAGATGPTLPPGETARQREDVGEAVYQSLIDTREMRFDVDFPFSAQWAVGCNMSFRRSLILDVGGFDENFQGFPLGDDSEFSYRVRQRGELRYVPEASLVHLNVKSGGCRDAASEREYVRQIAFCTNYFYWRINASVWRRWARVWLAFRQRVLNKTLLTRPNPAGIAVAFLVGAWQGGQTSRRVSRDAAAK